MTLFGCDSSNNNFSDPSQVVDFVNTMATGPFAWLEAKVSQGSDFQDEYWPATLAACHATSLPLIGYHYVDTSDPATQVECFTKNNGGTVAMLDFEDGSGDLNNYWNVVKAFNAAGIAIALSYIPQWYWGQIGSPDLSRVPGLISSAYPGGGGYPEGIYIAAGGDAGEGWRTYGNMQPVIWQYTNQASVGSLLVDCNAFRGTAAQLISLLAGKPNMSIPAANVGYIDQQFNERLGDNYVYGGVYSPDDILQGCDCSALVGWVLEGYINGPERMSWAHNVSTESWPYDYSTNTPAAPGTVGPYGTVAISGPSDIPAEAALLICIMHGGGGEDSHTACSTGPAITPTPLAAPAGKIMESNGDAGTCTNGTGGTPIDSDIWTDWWYLPGPISGDYTPPPPPPPNSTYTIRSGDTLDSIALMHGVSLAALEAANPQITDPNFVEVGQVIQIP